MIITEKRNTITKKMKYILYCRKSTESEDRQILSLDSQKDELIRLATTQGFEITKILQESKSAKAPGRPVFNEMLKLFESGKADAILCWKIDRLARNPVDGGQIQWLLQNNKIKCIQTFEKCYYPNDNVLLMSIEQAMASQYIRDLSSNVKRGNRAKLEKGQWPNRAPFGYLNDKATKTIAIDPVNAKYVVRAFELYATGGHGFKEIAQILYNEGLRTGVGKKVFFGNIHRFITDPFYYGIMARDGKLYQGIHTPLISKELYDQTQEVLHNKNRPRPKNHFFPLRGFLKCESCGCSLTASLKKGHHYYYCTNSKGICSEHKTYLRETTLYPIVASLMEKLNLDEEVIDMLYESAKEELGHDTTYYTTTISTLYSSLNGLKAKESRLLDTFLAQQVSQEIYSIKALEIQNEKVILEKQISDLEAKHKNIISTLEPTKNIFLRASRAMKEFLDGDDAKKREIVETILWNLTLKNQNMANYSFKSPYSILSKVPKNADFQTLCPEWESNPHPFRDTILSRARIPVPPSGHI